MARLLALDVGTVRIGVALSDATGILATPYTTLHVSRDEAQTRAAIQRLIEETEAEGLVIGLPISLDGRLHAQGERIQEFARRLQPSIQLPIIMWDERLSTIEAERLLALRNQDTGEKSPVRRTTRQSHSKRKRKGQQIDALAAAVILQDYLDQTTSNTGEKYT